jgi:hypothetical protein
MEHVPDIEASFREMARVVAPGGMIYCIAAPLWCSRSGPHWGSVFDDIPWPHLRFPKERTIEEGLKRGLSRHQVEYFLGNHCNKRRPEEYLAAASLPGLSAIRNEIAIEVCDGPPEIEAELHALGYTQQDLYGLTHTYMASKPLDAENGDRFGAG